MSRDAGAGPKVTLGDVAARLLDHRLPEVSSFAPILARRASAVRKLDEAKRDEREATALARAKKVLATQGHLTLRDKKGAASATDASSAVLEKTLRKIATRGVVQLFNAVRTAQKDRPREVQKKVKRQKRAAGIDGPTGYSAPLDLSRDSFLDILRRGSNAGKPDTARSSATFLRDDFMLGDSKAKHWGKPLDDEDAEEKADEAEGEMDFDDDEEEEEENV